MILTSKRCFLNILTQLWPAERLLNANYYVGDVVDGSGKLYNHNVMINDDGQHMLTNQNARDAKMIGTCHNIKLNKTLDPTPFDVEHVMGLAEGDEFQSSEERYISYLNNPETFIDTYNFLFKDQLQGNGVQILIFDDDPNLLKFGHIIAQYLSVNFGVDIMFIDPCYRPNCVGYPKYDGDKQRGIQMIKQIKDWDLLINFNQAVTASASYSSLSNIRTFMESGLFNDHETTMRLYQLLFPDDPLPPGNYSLSHIHEIILSRAIEGASRSYNNTRRNLFIDDWESTLNRIDQENADFENGADSGLF